MRNRNAFTLIELLVVMAIITVLMGLLLPAIQHIRESANRTQCANNLKQISLAILHYEEVYDKLPPSRVEVGKATWAVLIAPYLEQQNLFRQWNIDASYYDQTDVARMTRLSIFFCPSRRGPNDDPTSSISGDWGPAGTHVPGALGDYAACIDRSGHDESEETCPNMSGAFQWEIGHRLEEFTDGLSNTLLVGEKHVPYDKLGMGGWDCSLYDGGSRTCSLRPTGRRWPLTTDPDNLEWVFGSLHTHVVQFAFADGHVTGLPATIDLMTYERLGRRNDGEPVSLTW
ncbi:MAG: DUF1559 domain-containing protein [Gemmataceae bacterium]